MVFQPKGSIVARGIETALFFISLLVASAVFIPWKPNFSMMGLDPSWMLSLHYFFEHGHVFGKDIIFTYGPYGFISTYLYYPATYQIMVFAYLFFTVVYTAAGWNILRKEIKHKGGVFCAVLAATFFLAPAPHNFYAGDIFFYSCGVLFFASYLAESDKPYRWRNFFLVGVLAVISLMKYSFFIWAVGLLFFVSLDGIIFKKRWPYLFLLYGGFLVAFWVLAKQPLEGLGAFFLTGAHMARYYGSAMGTSSSLHDPRLVFYMILSLLLTTVFYIAQQRRTGPRAILPSLTLAAMAFLIYRASFTRDHSIIAMSYLAVLAVYLVPFLNTALGGRGWKILWAVLLVVTFTFAYLYSIRPFTPSFSGLAGKIWSSFSKMPHYTFVESRFLPRPKDLQLRYEEVRKLVRGDNAVPQLSGTVDTYPYDSTGLIAQDLSYRPRPVFQSYAAYTPFLSQKNADYLKSPRAPEFLVFGPNVTADGKPIDARYPTLDDSLSLPEIMSRYDFLAALYEKALLRKTLVPRPYSFILIEKVTAEFGETIPVPHFDEGPIWVEIEIKKTWLGEWGAFLGRAGRAGIAVRALDGKTYTYDLPSEMSRTGFLLSPVLDDPGGFIAFWTRHFNHAGLSHKGV